MAGCCLEHLSLLHIIYILDLNLVYCCRLLPSFPRGNIARRDFLQDGLGKGMLARTYLINI